MGREAPESYPPGTGSGGGKSGKKDGCGTAMLLMALPVLGLVLLLKR